ncbi:hypothetical protein Sjap_025767 [Stephania japonica]|uniref:Uncharacterized protein n=1 Tax=Stephania japonica TaxID=461633 RepID=A0AAP0E2E0_9MAGN
MENQITGILPSSIGNLKNLKSLVVLNNHINGTIPRGIGELSQLIYLDLSSNFFKGVVSESHFANLAKLEIFDLSSTSKKSLILQAEIQRMHEEMSQSAEEARDDPHVDETDLYYKVVGVDHKGQVYGLGSTGRRYNDPGASSSQGPSSQDFATLQSNVSHLTSIVEDQQNQIQTQHEQIALLQFMLMQSMRGGHPGASSSYPPSPLPPPPPPLRPRLRPPPPPRRSHQRLLLHRRWCLLQLWMLTMFIARECTSLKMKRKRTCHCSRSGSMHCPTHIPYQDLTETIDMIHLIYT